MEAVINPKDALELNVKYAETAARLLSFYMLASFAVAGWFFTSEALIKSEILSFHRWAVAVLYLIVAAFSIHSQLRYGRKMKAALDLADELADEDLRASKPFKVMIQSDADSISKIAMPVGSFLMIASILFWK